MNKHIQKPSAPNQAVQTDPTPFPEHSCDPGVQALRAHALDQMRTKARIYLEKAAFIYGGMDETGALKSGQVCGCGCKCRTLHHFLHMRHACVLYQSQYIVTIQQNLEGLVPWFLNTESCPVEKLFGWTNRNHPATPNVDLHFSEFVLSRRFPHPPPDPNFHKSPHTGVNCMSPFLWTPCLQSSWLVKACWSFHKADVLCWDPRGFSLDTMNMAHVMRFEQLCCMCSPGLTAQIFFYEGWSAATVCMYPHLM